MKGQEEGERILRLRVLPKAYVSLGSVTAIYGYNTNSNIWMNTDRVGMDDIRASRDLVCTPALPEVQTVSYWSGSRVFGQWWCWMDEN
jgi:hypothetical protein